MPDFDPDAPVIVEKTSDIGRMRKYYFNEGEFDTIEEVHEYLEVVSAGGIDSGSYEIRQPVGTVTIEGEQKISYSPSERATIDSIIEVINDHSEVKNVKQVDDPVFEWHIARSPYSLSVTGLDVDISVTLDSEKYEFETVEDTFSSQLSIDETVFFEGKVEKYNRGDREASEYKLFFRIERDLSSVSNARHLYQEVRKAVDGQDDGGEVIMVGNLRLGTTHSYVRGEPYPEETVLIDVADITTETSFMDDVVFTKEKTENEAFNEVRPTLEKYTKKSKNFYSNNLSALINDLSYEVEVIGAGEYSSGTETRLVLGLAPVKK